MTPEEREERYNQFVREYASAVQRLGSVPTRRSSIVSAICSAIRADRAEMCEQAVKAIREACDQIPVSGTLCSACAGAVEAVRRAFEEE